MSDLDKKLDEILKPVLHYCTKFPCRRCDASDKTVRDVKQALKDTCEMRFMEVMNAEYMTGQEWCDRFFEEFDRLSTKVSLYEMSERGRAIEAAKKAAGIES